MLHEFCLSTSAFSSIIVFHMSVQACNRLEIPEHRFRTLDTLKKMICLRVSQGLFLLSSNFHMNHVYLGHGICVMLYLCHGFFDVLIAAQAPHAQDATGSQEASIPTWNSRMLWQFGESRAREPSLPPSSMN